MKTSMQKQSNQIVPAKSEHNLLTVERRAYVDGEWTTMKLLWVRHRLVLLLMMNNDLFVPQTGTLIYWLVVAIGTAYSLDKGQNATTIKLSNRSAHWQFAKQY